MRRSLLATLVFLALLPSCAKKSQELTLAEPAPSPPPPPSAEMPTPPASTTQSPVALYNPPGIAGGEKGLRSNLAAGLALAPEPMPAPGLPSEPEGFTCRYVICPPPLPVNREDYGEITENPFEGVKARPLSTFSIDVDTGAYSNVRRFLTQGQMPPADALRIEEMINYFDYTYPQPAGEHPFAVHLAAMPAPWAQEHQLVRIGLKGREVEMAQRPASNLVFLVDVSGSMQPENKLPLLVRGMKMLTRQLDERDSVAIVTYAGHSGVALEPTRCTRSGKQKVIGVLDALSSGGATHGSAGLQKAYALAKGEFLDDGANRVILCTDGDFNVGVTDTEDLLRIIRDEAKAGIFLTVLGFGEGNLQDERMEQLADRGNGMYGYIDNISEARKMLVAQLTGSLITIAKDVKLQVEFNPAEVSAWRLIGYENRLLADENFNDDTKDAGEIGAGHTVTALYEIVPVGVPFPSPGVDPLKYQQTPEQPLELTEAAQSGELMTVKLRYKPVKQDTSILMSEALPKERVGAADAEMRFAAAVAAFGMLLRDSPYVNEFTYDEVVELARESLGEDEEGYRAEFLTMVRNARELR